MDQKIIEKRDRVIGHAIAQAKERLKRAVKKEPSSGVIFINDGTNLFMATRIMEAVPFLG